MTPGRRDSLAPPAPAAPLRLGYARPGCVTGPARDWRLRVTCVGLLLLGLVLFVGGLVGLVGVEFRSIGPTRASTS